MRTKQIALYQFSELSDDAQQTAIDNWRNSGCEYAWSDEWRDSLKAFADAIGARIKDYSISPYGYTQIDHEWVNSDWCYLDTNPAETMAGLRLRTWLVNNWLPLFQSKKVYRKGANSRKSRILFNAAPDYLTGYCGDMALLQPILGFIAKPNEQTSLNDLLADCFQTFAYAWRDDMEYQDSDEYIRECIECNEYEFLNSGEWA